MNKKDKKNISRLENIIASGFSPAYTRSSNVEIFSIYRIISKDKWVFLKLLRAQTFISLFIYVLEFILYKFGISGCYSDGNELPSFFCVTQENIIINSVIKLFYFWIIFIIASDLVILFFYFLGRLQTTKFNIILPKWVIYSFWTIFMLILGFFIILIY